MTLQYLKEGWRPHGHGKCRCPKCGAVTSTNALARAKHVCSSQNTEGPRKLTVKTCADRWIEEARRHEQAADAIYQQLKWNDPASMDEEQMLHLEIARVLRNCARDLERVQ